MLSHGKYTDSFQVAGFVDDDLYQPDIRIAGINVLGQRTDIPQLVKKLDIGIIVFAIHNISAEEKQIVLDICTSTPARVFLFPNVQAALNLISRNGNGDSHPKDLEIDFPQPPAGEGTTVAWTYDQLVAPEDPLPMMEAWLAEMEESARSGDTESMLTHIQEMRMQLKRNSYHSTKSRIGNQE
jgi:hypothetical protein